MLQPTVHNFETHTIVEQYANQVLDFSSQYGSDTSFSYTAANCLGKASKFPKYGDFSSTFVMRDYGPWTNHPKDLGEKKSPDFRTGYDHFIDLKFEHSVYVYSVYVYETFHPGAITAIFGGNCKGKWTKLWSGKTQTKVGHQPRIFSPQSQLTDFPINQLRLVFNQRHLSYYTEIDAVAMLGTLEPSTTEAKLLSVVSGVSKGPILKAVIRQRLYRCLTETLTTFQDILQLNLVEIGMQCLESSAASFKASGGGKTDCTSWSSAVLMTRDDGHFSHLPREIILYIFKFLDFKSLVRCSQVSSLFRDISYDSTLYNTVQLKQIFDKVNNETFKFLYNRADILTSLDLSWCGNYGRISPAVLSSFLSLKCENLVKLNVSNCHVFNNECLRSVSAFCPRLEDLSLSGCHMLDQFFAIPTLKRLNLYRTQVRTQELKNILEQARGLEYLNLGACNNVNADTICATLAKFNWSSLKGLDLWRSRSLTSRGVFSLSYVRGLLELDIGWCSGVDASSGCLVALVSSCKLLQKLSLPAQRQLSDRDMAAFRENLSDTLQQLNIMGTRNVSAESVLSLAQTLTVIRLLDIGYCEQLEDDPQFLAQLKSKLPTGCHVVSSFNRD